MVYFLRSFFVLEIIKELFWDVAHKLLKSMKRLLLKHENFKWVVSYYQFVLIIKYHNSSSKYRDVLQQNLIFLFTKFFRQYVENKSFKYNNV